VKKREDEMKRIERRGYPLRNVALLATIFAGIAQIAPAQATESTDAKVNVARLKPQEKAEGPLLRVHVNFVQLPVTVTDRHGRRVQGLTRDRFTVLEDSVPQPIESFSSEVVPASVGLVFDTSGSMKARLPEARLATRGFFHEMEPADEVFLLTFARRPQMQLDFTRDFEAIQNQLLSAPAAGSTSFFDAVYAALIHMRGAHNSRRALLVVSDGGDNHSRHTSGELLSLAREADVQIYTVSFLETISGKVSLAQSSEERAKSLLGSLATATGGFHYVLRNPNDLGPVMAQIGALLRNQYLIGYRSSQPESSGKWRTIQVMLDVPKGQRPVHLQSRRGYRAAETE
jgi:Ca-activated chloride channel family protein